jgi:hypothetical protein
LVGQFKRRFEKQGAQEIIWDEEGASNRKLQKII